MFDLNGDGDVSLEEFIKVGIKNFLSICIFSFSNLFFYIGCLGLGLPSSCYDINFMLLRMRQTSLHISCCLILVHFGK